MRILTKNENLELAGSLYSVNQLVVNKNDYYFRPCLGLLHTLIAADVILNSGYACALAFMALMFSDSV